jgi:epoxyqueuosine reductase
MPVLNHKDDLAASRAMDVKTRAEQLGFDASAIADASYADPGNHLGQWLAKGYHADMAWMARSRAVRQDVRLKVPGAASVVVVARNYFQPDPGGAGPECGRVARYAWGRDYHRVLRKPLQALARHIQQLVPDSEAYSSVDAGPVLERTWAERAGIGWVGKNGLILRRDLGSWFFLGTIITTVPLAPDAPAESLCGSCTRCLDACPTGAIVEDKVVDANRCIAYHTIENRGSFPETIQRDMGDWVFGCDICQDVCPWNRFAHQTSEPDFAARSGHATPSLDMLLTMTDEEFLTEFCGSPVMRAKPAGMRRNAAIALKNAHSRSDDAKT